MASFRIFRAAVCLLLLVLAATSVFPASAGAIVYEAAPVSTYDTLSPTLYGDAQFKASITAAMDVLKEEYPDDYGQVIYWVSEIRPTDKYTMIDNSGLCYIDADDARANPYWLAGVLIHEAQHTRDDNIYFLSHSYSARDSEARALDAQATYLGLVNSWSKDQMQSWVNGYLQTEYWETTPVKYGDAPL